MHQMIIQSMCLLFSKHFSDVCTLSPKAYFITAELPYCKDTFLTAGHHLPKESVAKNINKICIE